MKDMTAKMFKPDTSSISWYPNPKETGDFCVEIKVWGLTEEEQQELLTFLRCIRAKYYGE